MSTFAFLFLLAVVGAVAAFYMLRSGETLRFETSTDARRAVMAAVGVVAARRHWQVLSESADGASFQYRAGPRMLVAILLLSFFIVPGIVYIILANRRESLIVHLDSATGGMMLVQVTSNGFRGKFAGRALHRQLSLPAGSIGAGSTPVPVATSDAPLGTRLSSSGRV